MLTNSVVIMSQTCKQYEGHGSDLFQSPSLTFFYHLGILGIFDHKRSTFFGQNFGYFCIFHREQEFSEVSFE